MLESLFMQTRIEGGSNDNDVIPSPSSPPVNPAIGHFGDPEIK